MQNFKHYLITDPKYYSNDLDTFSNILRRNLQNHQVDIACFRDKISKNKKELAKKFVQVCREYKISKILINSDMDLALELKAHGVHLTSNQFDKIKEAKSNELFTIISCHSFKEIELAQNLGADGVTFSPIFHTPNKGEPLGLDKFTEAVNRFKIDIYALGGIVEKSQIQKLEHTGAKGFASIRYFSL